MTSSKKLAHIFIIGFPLGLILLFLLFPFYWTFVTSIKPESELYGMVVKYWPSHPTFLSYKKLFLEVNFLKPMGNSLLVSACTTMLAVTVSTLAAYAFTRYNFIGRKPFMILFLTNNMFPTVLLLIPLYSIMRRMGFLYTPQALILSYTTFTIPFSIWLLNGYLKDLPVSLEEAAMIDGANRAQAFLYIVLPILAPCMVATGVYIFMTSWNEYTFAVMFTNPNNRTIPVALRNLVGQLGVQWDLITTGGIITIIPVCVMFFFAQKRLVEGLTAGAVKG
jgi:multiple sugar transport system permease protein